MHWPVSRVEVFDQGNRGLSRAQETWMGLPLTRVIMRGCKGTAGGHLQSENVSDPTHRPDQNVIQATELGGREVHLDWNNNSNKKRMRGKINKEN